MSGQICKNCKHWEDLQQEDGLGDCYCPNTNFIDYTPSDFGCIHFKAIGSYEETQEWFLAYFSKDGVKCEGFELKDGNVYVRMEGKEPYELAYTKGWNETIIKVFNL